MTRFIKSFFVTLIALATLGLSGCKEKGEEREKKERPDKLEVVSLDKVSGSLTEGLKVTLTVKNNTAYNVRITAAEAFLQHQERKIGRLALNGEVILPRRSTTQVDVPIRITVSNFLSALAEYKLISQGRYEGFTVNYNATFNAGTFTFNLNDECVTLEEFAKDFNQGTKK